MKSCSLAFAASVFGMVLLSLMVRSQAAPAFFVFGDSLVDNGNNDYIPSTARADSRPYGIDSPDHRPTGRFSNGKNLPDHLCDLLGIPPLLPYLSPAVRGDNLLHGANFASAGVGILNDTGSIFVFIIRIQQQYEYFRDYQNRVADIIGVPATKKLVSEALVSITLGGNDYVNNYFLPLSPRARQYTLPLFTDLLVSEYKKQLAALYELGARKIVITSIGPLGCVPSVLATRSRDGECDPTLTQVASDWDRLVETMLDELRKEYTDAQFLFAAGFPTGTNVLTNPQAFGFETANMACCGQGSFNGQGTCTILSNLCPDRNSYVFWDPFHPTERAAGFLARGFMDGSTEYIRPINVRRLMGM